MLEAKNLDPQKPLKRALYVAIIGVYNDNSTPFSGSLSGNSIKPMRGVDSPRADNRAVSWKIYRRKKCLNEYVIDFFTFGG